jgi:hypothetical protein
MSEFFKANVPLVIVFLMFRRACRQGTGLASCVLRTLCKQATMWANPAMGLSRLGRYLLYDDFLIGTSDFDVISEFRCVSF